MLYNFPVDANQGDTLTLLVNGHPEIYIFINGQWHDIYGKAPRKEPMTEPPKAKSLNLELLIKLLKLTASSNDSEALLAMRKAHEVLTKFGGDWEALLHGKVTVIADPFTVAAPPPPQHHAPPPRAPVAPTPRKYTPTPQTYGTPASHARQQAAAAQKAQQTQAAWQAQQRQKAAAQAAAQTTPASRNTLRKMRIQLDDLA